MKQNNEIKEVWVPCKYIKNDGTVLDFIGLYEVSDLGRVRSLNYHGTGKTKMMKQQSVSCNEKAVMYVTNLHKNNIKYTLKVHRLVLSSFKEKEFFEGAICDHIVARSETSCNNYLGNLRWVTQKENASTEHCKETTSKTLTNNVTTSKRVKVTDLNTLEVTEYPSMREIWRVLGVRQGTVGECIRMRNGYYKKSNLHFAYVM